MEFVIDFVLIRKLTTREYRLAKQEIAALGIMSAFNNSLQRHDVQLATSADISTLACKQGCSWCCHFSVDVRPVEVFNIVHFITSHFNAERLERLCGELVANNEILAALDDEQRMRHNIKCPFLIEGSCSIYPVRPQTCRNYHATDSAGCQQSYEQPDNMDIAPEYAPITFQTGAAQVDAFAKAMQENGFVIDVFELNGAILDALDNPDTSWQRFTEKQSPFHVAGNDIPLEFMDMEE
jgi:Fe-S-cluster containining protein